jgi:hypothetical protein
VRECKVILCRRAGEEEEKLKFKREESTSGVGGGAHTLQTRVYRQ